MQPHAGLADPAAAALDQSDQNDHEQNTRDNSDQGNVVHLLSLFLKIILDIS
jgi:hypothetical protein